MAKVTIGGRDFEVFRMDAAGGSGRMRAVAHAEAALKRAELVGEEFWDRQAELVKAYLVEDIPIEELHKVLPARCIDIVRQLQAAAGMGAAPAGEPKSP